jgi:hypothetical protein
LGTPLLRFTGKLDRVSDLCGEKINAGQVDHALALARQELGLAFDFAMLAPVKPERGLPHYCLFIETDKRDLETVRARVEAYLAEGHHYRYCRKLNQLGPLSIQRVAHGWATYEDTLQKRGQRAGDIKPTHLDGRVIWAEAFATKENQCKTASASS